MTNANSQFFTMSNVYAGVFDIPDYHIKYPLLLKIENSFVSTN
jgi:hypothetical protein